MEKNEILILTTGGTIEKSYNESDGQLKNRNSMLKKRLLSKIRLPHTQIELQEVMAKDSLDMTDGDRAKILQFTKTQMDQAPARPVLILHGTDTMTETSQLFYLSLPSPNVPIVFTGAMRPMGFEDSDAMQNIVEALLATQLLAPGIYVSFHGRIFPLPNVAKDRARGTFVTSSESLGESDNA